MSHARRGKPTQSLDAAKDAHGNEPMDGQPTAEDVLATEENVTLVHQALAEPTTEYRQIIVLRELEGCRYDEIAEILDLPVGTVRSRLFRARMALRERLAPS